MLLNIRIHHVFLMQSSTTVNKEVLRTISVTLLMKNINIGSKGYHFQQLTFHISIHTGTFHNIFIDHEFICEYFYTSLKLFLQLNRD